MAKIRDWEHHRRNSIRLLEERTGKGLAVWNARIAKHRPKDKAALRAWLTSQGVDGYPRMLLIMERFGYPDYATRSADQLVDAQYEGRPQLRKVYDKVIAAASRLGDVTVQTRKTYVSLVTPRRTFARVQAAKDHVKVALRLDGRRPGGRLQRSKVHDGMPVEVALATPADVDAGAIALLREAYEESV
ncbi:MAG TPA: DUF5655 domain-containing protein [Vicinamibacterales bacterium]